MEFQVANIYPPGLRDPEPWGRAFATSVGAHAALLLAFLVVMKQPPVVQTVLTEINFIEQPAPKAVPVEKTRVGAPARGSRGQDQADSQVGGPGLDVGGGRGARKTSRSLTNKTAVSSAEGVPEGQIVTSEPMSGPIVAVEQFGVVGKKKGALVQLGGDTGGTKKGTISIPAGAGYAGKTQIALATMDVGELKKKESSIGVPLISQGVVTNSMGGRIRELATAGVGQPKKKATIEQLKSNPLDKEKWGKAKGPFSMEGPLKYRKILKMELPPYPRWAEEKAIETSVSLRLWVDAKGRVKGNMYLEKTSGYSELDYLAKEALMKFVFVTIPAGQPQDDEWGVATFRFELTK